METLSQLQARLSPPRWDNRTFNVSLDYFSELFSAYFVEDGKEAWFVAEPHDLREILHQLLLIGASLDIDVGIAVRKKYRNRCPRCRENPCICWDWDEKPLYYPYPGPLPAERTLWEVQRMLNGVFPKRHTLAEEVQHVRNEIAELLFATEYQDRDGAKEEIADVFTWLVRVANTLDISLDEQRPLAR